MPELHPFCVHFTLAFLTLGLVLDLVGLLRKSERLRQIGTVNFFVGAGTLLFTVLSGLLAEQAPHPAAAHQTMTLHKCLGLCVTGIASGLVIWRLWQRRNFPGRATPLYFFLAIASLLLLGTGGYLGGKLVYTHGVGVRPINAIQPTGHHHQGEGNPHGTEQAAGKLAPLPGAARGKQPAAENLHEERHPGGPAHSHSQGGDHHH